jgi:HKD family nuclease
MHQTIPSPGLPNGREALRTLLKDAQAVDVAVAFVTQSGVGQLRDLLDKCGSSPTMRFVVRGAPITDPEALVALSRFSERASYRRVVVRRLR